MLLNCGVGEDSWESLGLQGDPTSPSWRRSVLSGHWKDWCWSWNSSTSTTSCEELTHWKRPWCWDALGAGGEGDDRGWDGWMASLTQWTWLWVNSGSWWWTGRPGVLRFMGLQRVGHDWVTELNWSEMSEIKNLELNPSKIKRFGKHCRLFTSLAGGFQPRAKGFKHEGKSTIRDCGRILGRGRNGNMSWKIQFSSFFPKILEVGTENFDFQTKRKL